MILFKIFSFCCSFAMTITVILVFSEIDEFQVKDILLAEISQDMTKYFSYEGYFNIAEVFFCILSNNWLLTLFSLFKLAYNGYAYITDRYKINYIIGLNKENRDSSKHISLIYKIKFLLYCIVTIVSLTLLLLEIISYFYSSNRRQEDKILRYFKLFK